MFDGDRVNRERYLDYDQERKRERKGWRLCLDWPVWMCCSRWS